MIVWPIHFQAHICYITKTRKNTVYELLPLQSRVTWSCVAQWHWKSNSSPSSVNKLCHIGAIESHYWILIKWNSKFGVRKFQLWVSANNASLSFDYPSRIQASSVAQTEEFLQCMSIRRQYSMRPPVGLICIGFSLCHCSLLLHRISSFEIVNKVKIWAKKRLA